MIASIQMKTKFRLRQETKITFGLVVLALCLCAAVGKGAEGRPSACLRPPSVPLVACDPYFSIWSPADNLAGADTVHWTGKPHRLTSIVRIDGKGFRILGKEPAALPALVQTGVDVLPTRTICTFCGEGVRLTLTFMTAALPHDLMTYSLPITYVTWAAQANEAIPKHVQVWFDASAEIAINEGRQVVVHQQQELGGLSVLRLGSEEQPILAKRGDDLRIDWGSFHVGVPISAGTFSRVIPMQSGLREAFAAHGMPVVFTGSVPATATGNALLAACAFDLGKVSRQIVSRQIILAYDDEFSIQYFKHNLRPYWRRDGDDATALLTKATADYESLKNRCASFDADFVSALAKAGGGKYARLCALAYRQCYAANKLVADANGQPLLFPKENFSNGCIGTVDVIYPMAPQFLFFSPTLTKAMLVPILDYAASPRWHWPFAPHDLGTYPQANGQVYGGGERTQQDQMPVEETGNMLLLLAALAQIEGKPDFCAEYWPVLELWADYLKAKGFDPEHQLCTDDFAGHLAHNVNLSAKAICGLGAFARLCEMRGQKTRAGELMKLAKGFADRWVKEAEDGDHFRLAFDKPGTWSQKYNLVWDRILGLHLFPASVAREEMAFYKTRQNEFGLPLDCRKQYTKLDWTLWTATLTQNRSDFEALLNPVWRFLNETPTRVPMTDWFWTQNAQQQGFQARSVVGGVFLQMLYKPGVWKHWASRDKTKAANWAPLPKIPKMVMVVPTSENIPIPWRYTTEHPPDDWLRPDFDASAWNDGPGGFGTQGTPGAVVRTEWKTSDIWLRREFALPDRKWNEPQLRLHHDEDAEVYIDGILAAKIAGYVTDYETVPITTQARTALGPGKHLLAVHCKQTTGGQFIDVGLADEAVDR